MLLGVYKVLKAYALEAMEQTGHVFPYSSNQVDEKENLYFYYYRICEMYSWYKCHKVLAPEVNRF